MSATSDMVREKFKKGDDIRDAGLMTPPDINRYDDIVYGELPEWQCLDVYRPKSSGQKKLPVIVNVHGGGWVYGDKERYQFYCMNLAQRGFAVVNFTYRLAPEFKFPAPIEDTNSVFAWVFEHAEMYGFDTEHIFAVGDSAGANILALYCAVCTNPAYAMEYRFQAPDGFVPKAVALNCGTYRILLQEEKEGSLTRLLLADFLLQKGNNKEMELINVLNHITEKFPPVFCMTAAGDFLKGQAPALAGRLVECNVPFVCRMYGSAEPGPEPGHVFHCDIRSDAAKQCNDDECDFFKRFL